MKIDLASGEFQLAENRPLRLVDARGWGIRCTAGIAWITVAGEAADIFLAAGESYRIPGAGTVLVEAVGSGSIRVNPEPGAAGGRLCSLASRFALAVFRPIFR